MVKIPLQDIMNQFMTMLYEHWEYVPGGASYGKVDCSGAFVYAYHQFGKNIPPGSNAIARNNVGELYSVLEAKPGMAAFKFREPGDEKYALPEKYRDGGSEYNGDLNDYYHIGLVDGTGKNVINAQSSQTGVVLTPIEKWGKVAYLNEVDYSNESSNAEVDIPMETNAIAKTDNGLGVNFRKEKSINAGSYGKIPEGAAVLVTGMDGEWSDVTYNGHSGYVMSKFLSMTSNEVNNGQVMLPLNMDVALELYKALGKVLGESNGAVG